jgi:toxin YoeB
MKTILADEFLAGYAAFRRSNPEIVVRIDRLVRAVEANPTVGIGKPERLRHQLSGLWSRRIDREHRLVYRVEDGKIIFMRCRGHYSDR